MSDSRNGCDNLTAVLHQQLDMRLENRPKPTHGPDEVLLAIKSVGICGSDVHYWADGACGRFVVTNPIVMGHETSAEVVSVGADVEDLKPGDRVAIEPGVPCRKCQYCKKGDYNVCPEMKFCATPPIDGTLTRFYTHPADFCFKLPEHVTFDEGAMLEPISVAVWACQRAGVTVGTKVLVTGAGPVGILSMMVAKAFGAESVCITDISQSRLDFATKMGADCTLMSNVKPIMAGSSPSASVISQDVTDLANRVQKMLSGMPEAAIECSGSEMCMNLAIAACAPRGKIVTVGRGKKDQTIAIAMASTKELDIRGIFRYANCYPTALNLVSTGKIDVKPLVSHRFILENALEAFEVAKRGEGMKVIIDCSVPT